MSNARYPIHHRWHNDRILFYADYGRDAGDAHVLAYHLWLAAINIPRRPYMEVASLRISPADWSR